MLSFRYSGSAVVYRLFDVGYAIDLARAQALLTASAAANPRDALRPERVRPVRGEAQALQILNPPITVVLGHESFVPAPSLGTPEIPMASAELSARIFDFGVISLRIRVRLGDALSWEAFTAMGRRVEREPQLIAMAEQYLAQLAVRIADAVERPQIAEVRENHTVFRVTRVVDGRGQPVEAEALAGLDVVPLLLDEDRALSAEARRDLLPHRFSYYHDDLTILTWESALVVEPGEHDTDLQYVLEFANAQLLELRYYDAILDAELPRLYDAIEAARRKRSVFPGRRFGGLLARLHTVVADTTEVVEQVENALKVTDDVYLARVYGAAMELFRGRAWRAGIDRKLAILRETYAMLNDEAQASRSETLEIAIVVLIVLETVMAWWRG